MRNYKNFSAVVFVSAVLVLSACDSNRWFLSEDTLRSKIQHTWDMVLIPARDSAGNPYPPESWMFTEGKIYRYTYNDTMVGNYSISTTLTKAFLTITDLNPDNELYNAKWEIIELDRGLLFIATDHNGTSGLKQKEFTER